MRCLKMNAGSMRDEENELLLSQLTHTGYCLRRAALVMNKQLWSESADTAKGRVEHERVHNQCVERRGNQLNWPDSVRFYRLGN